MEIWIYSCTAGAEGFAGGGALSTGYTVEGLRRRGHTVRVLADESELRRALRALATGKPDVPKAPTVLVHHNTKGLETVQALAERAGIPFVPTVQIGLDCGSGLHVAFPGEKQSAWNTVAGLAYNPFGYPHRRCTLGIMMREMMVKKGSALQKLEWMAGCPARLARRGARLRALDRADAVVAISPTIAGLVKDAGVRREITVVPQPVDERLFAAQKQAEGKRKNILFLGGMSWLKGAHLLLEAFAGVKDPKARLWFAGPSGDTEADFDAGIVRAWAKDARIEWLGLVNGERARDLYARADVVAFPSICFESFGRVWAEACATGTPVLAFKGRGGAADFLEHGKTGWLCDLSVESLRAGLKALLADEGLRKRLGRGAKEMALNKLHPQKIVESLEGVYGRACR